MKIRESDIIKNCCSPFRGLDIYTFMCQENEPNWKGHVNKMDSKSKVSQVFNNNPQGSRLRVRPKNRWWNCVQTDINKCKITNWRDGHKTKLTGKSPFRR